MILNTQVALSVPDESLIPTDKTKTYSLLSTQDETRYYLNNLLHQNPKVKDIVIHTFGDGVHHVGDAGKKISYRVSTDKGATFGSKATLYDPTDGSFQIQDPSAGFDHNGRLHIFADCHDSVGTPGGNHELRYMYSDDNGTTVSSPTVITLPSNGLNTFRMYGRVIDLGNGVLLAPAYFQTDEGDTTQSSRYVLKSTDGGSNWSWKLVDGPTSAYINESELLAVTNNIVVMMSRYEGLFQFWMYKSTDQGETWTNIGVYGTGIALDSPHGPCRLHKFRADTGQWMSVMYFPHKSTGRLYAIYGRLDNGVDGDIALFNKNTATLLRDDTVQLHYGDFVHYNNNMNARGAWSREQGSFPTDNELIYFENLTTQYDTVTPYTLPITIFDKIGAAEMIVDWRGLANNTANDWGVVDGSNQVTQWKSIKPAIARTFSATAGGILLGTGVEYDGTKALTYGTAADFGFMSHSGVGLSDINYAIFTTVKFGTASDPNAAYGLFGTSGATTAAIGCAFLYDDRVSQGRNNMLLCTISDNAGGTFIVTLDSNSLITPNTFMVLCIVVDLAEATDNNKIRIYINNVLQSTTATYTGGTSGNPPTRNPQIGACGNNVLIAVGAFKQMVIQNAIPSAATRTNMIQALMDINGIT